MYFIRYYLICIDKNVCKYVIMLAFRNVIPSISGDREFGTIIWFIILYQVKEAILLTAPPTCFMQVTAFLYIQILRWFTVQTKTIPGNMFGLDLLEAMQKSFSKPLIFHRNSLLLKDFHMEIRFIDKYCIYMMPVAMNLTMQLKWQADYIQLWPFSCTKPIMTPYNTPLTAMSNLWDCAGYIAKRISYWF